MAAEHEAARRVAVEPMRQRGVARQAEAQVAEEILEDLAALGAAMHGQAGGLVHHQNQPVAIEQSRKNLFRRHAVTGFSEVKGFRGS